jgi:uncharacterized phosphosugar-binding protein
VTTISADRFFEEAARVIDRLRATQGEPIRRAAARLGERMLAGGLIHVFGTGHSRAFAMELYHRAGGLVLFNAVMVDDLLRGGRSVTDLEDASIERDPANAHALLSLHDVRPEDAFIIVSNSGRNGLIVEMAQEVVRRRLPLVAVTSLDHAARVTSRHPSGKRLHEIAEIVIDNCGPYGDALLPVPGQEWSCCAVSSITGALIAQALTAELVGYYLAHGETPPVLVSANVDAGDAHNADLLLRHPRLAEAERRTGRKSPAS